MKPLKIDPRLERVDPYRLRVPNPQGIDATLFAGEDVPVETAAVDELLALLGLKETAHKVADATPEAFDDAPGLCRVAVTPDFHKARGIPVGTVLATKGFLVPQAIGNDINCGMRLHLTSLNADDLRERRDEIEADARHVFFEGGRNIPMTRQQRLGLFTNGLEGLADATPATLTEGIWSLFHETGVAENLDRVEKRGSLPASRVFGLDDLLGTDDILSRDSQIGSIGGGNHFVELQEVVSIQDRPTAHAWGIKPGMVTVMVHTGSISVGHVCGTYYRDVVRDLHPSGLKHPENGIFILPEGDRYRETADLFWDALHNAGNFAFANRLFLALMTLMCLRKQFGEVAFDLLYDAPHNFVWKETVDGETYNIHRKGATTARGMSEMAGTPFAWYGEPVLVPGSMGASSFILAGGGNTEALLSASHGAGRTLSRGKALHGYEEQFQEFLREFRVVTPVDLRRQDVKARPDIVKATLDALRQEAPYAYKGVGPVIQTLNGAGIARTVAELRPLMTVKG